MFGSGTQGGISNLNSNNLNPSSGLGKQFSLGTNFNTSGTPGTTGLFGNQNSSTNAAAPSQNSSSQSGLFGNSMTNSLGSKPGMENKPSIGNNLFGGSFDKSNTGPQTSMDKLGNLGTQNAFSKPVSFGNGQMGQNQNVSMLGGINNQTNTNSNPYNYDSVLRNIQRVEDVMPKSVTEDVFESSNDRKDSQSLFVSATKPARKLFSGVSYLSGLGRKLGFLRSSETRKRPSASTNKRGIFTQSNYTNINESQYKSQPNAIERNNLRTPYRSPLEFQGFKKLVVTSKPSKFHLINADNVMNRKRRRIFLHSNLITNEGDVSSENENSELSTLGGKKFSHEETTRPVNKKRKMGNNEGEKVHGKSAEKSDGYWCSPAIEELEKLSTEDLSHVENFILGRVGRGQISYDYPVDLTSIFSSKEKGVTPENFLFGNIVEIDHKIVRAYHKSERSPSIGSELNVPATISLEGIKPKDGVSSSLFINYLKKQIGMEFVTYDPVTCVWTFKVKHFSVWGLIDEEQENDESNLAQAKRKQDASEGAAVFEYSRIYDNETLNQELKKQKLNNQTKAVPGNWDYVPPNQNNILNIKRDLVSDEIQRQLNLHKEKQTALSLSENLSDITIESEDGNDGHRGKDYSLSGPLVPKERRNYDYMKRFVSGIPPDIDMNEIVAEKAYEPDISDDNIFDKIQTKPNLAVSDDWLVQLELANDVTSSLNKNIFSDQLTVNWKKFDVAKADEILFSEFNRNSIPSNHVSTPVPNKSGEETDKLKGIPRVNVQSISSCLSLMMKKSSFRSRSNGYPQAEDVVNLYFKDLIQSRSLSSGDSDDYLLWFGSSLFDDIEVSYLNDAQKTFTSRNTPISRKDIFCEYLKSYNQNIIEELVSYNGKDSLEKVFIKICAGNLREAVELAINSGNPHLAVVITFLDSNNERVKEEANSQLNYWSENHSLSLIPNSILKIYKILSGEFSEILAGLPWNVALLVILRYGKKDTDINDIFKLFINRNSGDGKFFDILRFYTQFHSSEKSKVFELIKDSSLDVPSKWYYVKLLASNAMKDDDITTDVSLLFGQLLEQNRLWKEAIYVYSHITDDKTAETMIRKVIIPHIEDIISKAESGNEYLVSFFNVPESLIYEAIAAKEHAAGNIWEACDALITAHLWQKAHECLLKELGPLTVISNNGEFRSKFVQLVNKFPESGHIVPEWNQGAGVYLTFINLISLDPSDDERLTLIKTLTSSIPLLPEPESIDGHIALKLMSKRVGELALSYQKLFDNIKERIFNLKLGALELNYFTRLLENLDF